MVHAVIAGWGNVGYHLAKALAQSGINITIVSSQSGKNAYNGQFSDRIKFISDVDLIDGEVDYCFLTLKDDGILQTAKKLPPEVKKNAVLVHCSGVLPADHLGQITERWGLFYPLNSFSKTMDFQWKGVPLFIDAATEKPRIELWELAKSIGARPVKNSDKDREILHIAAVFANNFSNHILHLSHQILEEKGIPFDLLMPLIRTTVEKISHLQPEEAQTGPAKRGDIKTIQKHLEIISDEEIKEVYKILSVSINPELKNKIL